MGEAWKKLMEKILGSRVKGTFQTDGSIDYYTRLKCPPSGKLINCPTQLVHEYTLLFPQNDPLSLVSRNKQTTPKAKVLKTFPMEITSEIYRIMEKQQQQQLRLVNEA